MDPRATAGPLESAALAGQSGRVEGVPIRRAATQLAERFGLVFALLVALAAFSIILPDIFPTLGNLKAMIDSQAIILLLAIAVTLPLRMGDFDLSIAGLMTASGCAVAQLTTHGTSQTNCFYAP